MENKKVIKEININSVQKNRSQTIQWYPGHMAKAKRNMEKDLTLVDMVIQVLDARAPRSSFNPELKRLAGKKPQILLMTNNNTIKFPCNSNSPIC